MGGVRGVVVLGCLAACGSSGVAPDAATADAAVSDAPGADAAIDAPIDASPDASPDAPAPAALTLTSPFQEFGSVPVGTTSPPITVTAQNSGGTTTGTLAVMFQMPPQPFSISADGCSGQTLAAGASCTFQVRFVPTSVGVTAATVDVGDGSVTASRQLVGTATTNDDFDFLTPSFSDFGSVPIGSSAMAHFVLTNAGGTTHGPHTVSIGGPSPGAYAVASDTCTGNMLPPVTACAFDVVFTPQVSGIANASVEVTTPTFTSLAAIRGNGLDPVLQPDLALRNFGSVPVGERSAYARFVITNTSAATTGALTTTLAGMHPGDFTIAPGANTCQTATLAAGATCFVDVRFEPTAVQRRDARLVVADGAHSAATDLTGDAGSANTLLISPTPFSFGDVPVGQASAPQIFTITNLGSGTNLPLNVFSSSSVFVVSSDQCSNLMLPPGASCTFAVTAHPSATGVATQEVGTFVYSALLVRGVP